MRKEKKENKKEFSGPKANYFARQKLDDELNSNKEYFKEIIQGGTTRN